MLVQAIDPRDIGWEVEQPVYRVHFWWQPQPETGWSSAEYRLSEVLDVQEVLAWARQEAQDRRIVIYVERTNNGERGLLRLYGKTPVEVGHIG